MSEVEKIELASETIRNAQSKDYQEFRLNHEAISNPKNSLVKQKFSSKFQVDSIDQKEAFKPNFNISSFNSLRFQVFRSEYSGYINQEDLKAAKKDLEIPEKPEKELKMTFEMSEEFVPFLYNKYLDWRIAAHISGNLLAICEINFKDVGGCGFLKAAPGFVYQLEKNTQFLGGLRVGAVRGAYIGARHFLDKDIELGFRYEQDLSTFNSNSSALKLDAILFGKYNPFIELQSHQALAGMIYDQKFSDNIGLRLTMDSILRTSLILGQATAELDYKITEFARLSLKSSFYGGQNLHNSVTLNYKLFQQLEGVVGFQQRSSSIRTVVGLSVSGYQFLFGVSEILQQGMKEISKETKFGSVLIYGVAAIFIPKLIEIVKNWRNKPKRSDPQEDTLEAFELAQNLIESQEQEKETKKFARLMLFQEAIRIKSLLNHDAAVNSPSGLIFLLACCVRSSEQAEKLVQDFLRSQNGLSEEVSLARCVDILPLIRWRINQNSLQFKNDQESLFLEQENSVTATHTYTICLVYRIGATSEPESFILAPGQEVELNMQKRLAQQRRNAMEYDNLNELFQYNSSCEERLINVHESACTFVTL